jgi:hypothetical protein
MKQVKQRTSGLDHLLERVPQVPKGTSEIRRQATAPAQSLDVPNQHLRLHQLPVQRPQLEQERIRAHTQSLVSPLKRPDRALDHLLYLLQYRADFVAVIRSHRVYCL